MAPIGDGVAPNLPLLPSHPKAVCYDLRIQSLISVTCEGPQKMAIRNTMQLIPYS